MKLSHTTYSCFAASVGDYVVVAGGANDPSLSNAVDIFNIRSLTFVKTVQMSQARMTGAIGVLGPFVYIAGGATQNWDQADSSTILGTVEVVDSRDWSVFPAPSLASPRRQLMGASVPGYGVYFIGGWGGTPLYDAVTTIDYYTCGNGVRIKVS